jgi:O-methyltransferase involved in polyketide biosynthesis
MAAIRDVSDTAYLVAAVRARESARSDALFSDPMAGLLAGDRGDGILARLPAAFMSGWTVVIRTMVIDAFIREAVAGGTDVIVNLGAGFDTRPYRMDLPAHTRWIEVDYPEVLAAKAAALAGPPAGEVAGAHADEQSDQQSEAPAGVQARCRLKRVGLDLTDRAALRGLLAHAAEGSQAVLVLTEGVVPYLSLDDVEALADDLAACEAVQGWIVDYFSDVTRKYRRKRNRSRFVQNAPFRFDPDDWFGFFAAHGWRPREVRYLAEEGDRLGRPIRLPLRMRLVVGLTRPFASRERREQMLRFAGHAVLERAPADTTAPPAAQ